MQPDLKKVVADLMPEDAILYTPERFPDWQLAAMQNEDGEFLLLEYGYAIVWLVDGSIVYVPFIASGRFLVPIEGGEKYEVHPITNEILESYIIKAQKKEQRRAWLVGGVLLMGILAPIIISNHKERQMQEAVAVISNAMMVEARQKQEKKMSRQQDLQRLQTRIASLSKDENNIYVLTNVQAPIKARLIPKHPGFGFGISLSSHVIDAMYDGNPAKNFLDNEATYGYTVALSLPGDTLVFRQSNYFPSYVEMKPSEPEDTVVLVTVSKKLTGQEIDDMVSDNVDIKTRADAERFFPSLRDGFYRRQYMIKSKELVTGKLASSNSGLKNLSFDDDNTFYFLSAIDSRLPIKDQDALLKQFTEQFGINKSALNDCCSWQRVTL